MRAIGLWAASFAALSASSCTDPVARVPPIVAVVVEADSVVRDETARVEVEVDGEQEEGAGWQRAEARSYRDDPERPLVWPIQFHVDRERASAQSFSLLAIAYDAHDSVVARAQAIRTRNEAKAGRLRVNFDTACFRQPMLCAEGSTCHRGSCVSARSEPPPIEGDGGPDITASTAPGDGLAQEKNECERDGERACAGHGTRQPLRCEDGMWRTATECAEDERCDTSRGEARGLCKPIASECLNQEVNVPFCDDEKMLVCTDLVSSQIRPCSEHRRCAPDPAGAECKCEPGYVEDGARCVKGTECGDDRGGCDPLTECSMKNGERICSVCPPGYDGNGKDGCTPTLEDLALDTGVLEPRFDPSVREYVVRVPVAVPRVAFIARAPAETHISFDSVEVPSGEPWTTPMLQVGSRSVELRLATDAGESASYALTIERSAEQETYVKTSNSEEEDWLGLALALSGDRFVAGAPGEDGAGTTVNGDEGNGSSDSGASYVFVRDGDTWSQEAYLKASDAQPNDNFGLSVAIEGNTIAVGAARIGISSLTGQPTVQDRGGAAYVFTREPGGWSEQQRLEATEPTGGDQFGASVALAGDTLAVGVPSGASNPGGAVYVFQRAGASWSALQTLTPSTASDEFGRCLALDGDRLIVGAPWEDDRAGAAYVFERSSEGWVQVERLQPESLESGSKFGSSVTIRGDRAAAGAPHHPDSAASGGSVPPGEVYVFERAGERWVQSAFVRAPISDDTDYFGVSVALSPRGLAIGSNGEASGASSVNGDAEDNSVRWAGAAYLFADTGDSKWKSSVYLKPSNPGFDADFGFGVALDDDVFVVAAPFEAATTRGIASAPSGNSGAYRSGAVYVFR